VDSSLLVPCGEVVNQSADAARGCSDACFFFAAGNRADSRARSGAAADDQRFLFPGPFVGTLWLGSGSGRSLVSESARRD
jgi:hypothetical protein